MLTVGFEPTSQQTSGRRDLYLSTHYTHNKYPCYRWDSNPQSQQVSGRRDLYLSTHNTHNKYPC